MAALFKRTIEETPFKRIQKTFETIVKTSRFRGRGKAIVNLDSKSVRERLRGGVRLVAEPVAMHLTAIIDGGVSEEEACKRAESHQYVLTELVRLVYQKEFRESINPPPEVWSNLSKMIDESIASLDKPFERDMDHYHLFLEDTLKKVDELTLLKELALDPNVVVSVREEYLHSAAVSYITEWSSMSEVIVDAYAALDQLEGVLDADTHVVIENEVVHLIALTRASFVMSDTALALFDAKLREGSQKLLSMKGSIMVSRDEDADVKEIDAAVIEHLKRTGGDVMGGFPSFDPSAKAH